MRFEVDQSGRVEETNRPTVVAAACDTDHQAVIVSARTKRDIFAYFSQRGKRRMFAVKTFAALTFLSLKPFFHQQPEITIDLEYPGHEILIKNLVLTHARTAGLTVDRNRIHFAAVGKRSPSHSAAIAAFRRQANARRITFAELIPLLVR